jgi:hypothetical protein
LADRLQRAIGRRRGNESGEFLEEAKLCWNRLSKIYNRDLSRVERGISGEDILSFHELSTLPTIIAGTGEEDGLATAAPCDFDGLKFVII